MFSNVEIGADSLNEVKLIAGFLATYRQPKAE
jgi:hypothetical protein